MKNFLFFSICLSGLLGAQTYSNPFVYPIPDNNVTGVKSDISVVLQKTISDASKVTVNIDLSHSWCGDIIASLLLPTSSPFATDFLINRLGKTAAVPAGSSANFLAGNVLSFNAAFTTPIIPPNGTSLHIPAGNYKPTASDGGFVADLATLFNNAPVYGIWSLQVIDFEAGDTGSLNNWNIVFDAGAFLGVDTQMISNPGLSVMQNPFTETLNLKVNNMAKEVRFDIYAMDGKVIYSYNQSNAKNTGGNLQIPTANWAPGTYILAPMVNGEKLMRIKLLKK